jgi:hypothetical protein
VSCDFFAAGAQIREPESSARFARAHRPYEAGAGVRAGMKMDSVQVPPFLPDTPEVRSDLLDYYFEIQTRNIACAVSSTPGCVRPAIRKRRPMTIGGIVSRTTGSRPT